MTKNVLFLLLVAMLSLASCSSIFKPEPKDAKFGGMSVKYPGNWELTTEMIGDGSYMLQTEKKVSGHLFMAFEFEDDESSPQDIIDSYLSEFDSMRNLKATQKEAIQSKFGSYDGLGADYTLLVDGHTSYGTIWSFELNDKLYMIVCQGPSENEWKNDFEGIKESFKID